MFNRTRGFTLLELLVVLAVAAILVTVVVTSFSDSQAQSRDAKRKADLRQVQNAVELFKNKYGHYPSGCNASTTGNSVVWSGEEGTGEECSSGNQYIVNLAPEFMPELPRDPLAGRSGSSGYVYAVNDSGTSYKFVALNAVETETITQTDEFYRCGLDFQQGPDFSGDTWDDPGMCFRVPNAVTGTGILTNAQNPECWSAAEYNNDLAVSSGFSSDARGQVLSSDRQNRAREYDTEIVRCK